MRNLVIFLVLGVSVSLSGIVFYKDVINKDVPQTNYSAISIKTIVADENVLASALKQMGIKATIKKLVDESSGGSLFDCHQEAHKIGRISFSIYKEKSFADGDASCHSGFYHGAMESFLNEKGTVNIAENINSVCDLFNTGFSKFECLHGVGHGLLAYVDYDMPSAIAKCKELNNWFGTVSCYGGMFMENILTGQGLGAGDKDVHTTKWVNRTDPLYPCNALDENDYDLQYQCYQMQTSWMLTLFNYDFAKVKDECLKTTENMISVCFKSFGRDASGNTLRNPEKIMAHCALVPKIRDYYEQCLIGAVNVIVDFWGPVLKDQATELCKLPIGHAKQICYQTLAGRIPDLVADKSRQVEICDTFEKDYKELCADIDQSDQNSLVDEAEGNKSEDKVIQSGPVDEIIAIMMEGMAYAPSQLHIKRGQVVRFFSGGDADYWPASNIHPEHSIYPEFDPKQPIERGGYWEFKFDKEGEWRMHDHMYPDVIHGVIYVSE